MEVQVLSGFFYWLLLPLCLLAACLFRYNALSLIYLLYLLLLPLFFGPSERTVRGHTGRLIKALLGTSILFLCAHGAFQIALYVLADEDLLGNNCSTWETLSRHIGVTRLDLNDIPNCIRLVAPDLGIFLISCITLAFCNGLTKSKKATPNKEVETAESNEEQDEDEEAMEVEDATEDEEDTVEEERQRQARLAVLARLRVTAQRLLEATGKAVAILFLALAGITVPSAFSGVYYLLFIGISTWWACHFPMSHVGFNTICVMVAFYTAGHVICLYIYQTAFIQEIFPPNGLWSRLFGLKDIIHSNCSNPHELVLNVDHAWPAYANPAILLLLYYTIASLLKLKKKASRETDGALKNGEEVELTDLEPWSAKQDELEDEAKPMLQPVNGEQDEGDNCTLHIISGSARPDAAESLNLTATSKPRKSQSPLRDLGHLVMQQSYICALIVMMVWSITFHSWLTFVLLIWACLIWIVRSRRQLAMLCSPFILLYGIILCSLQYVWGMDLTEELPTKIGFMALTQLGLVRMEYHCLRLGVVLLYTLTFWLLLRQFVKEKCMKQEDVQLKEVTVAEAGREKSEVLKALGELVMSFYAKYWIYVCGGMFFIVSFTGRIVVYKIVYMFLFLLCLSFYQVCYFLWRKLLKIFWWLVVAYTMLVLISVYTFQFAEFPHYWKNFTGLTDEQLADMGLEQFSVSELFSSILIPAFFLLACILQLHYFHRRFMQITDLEHVPTKGNGPLTRLKESLAEHSEERPVTAPLQNGAAEDPECGENDQPAPEDSRSEGEIACSKWGLVVDRLLVLCLNFSKILNCIQVIIWRLLELHVMKLVALFSVWVAVKEPSVMNFLFIVLWAFAMPYTKFRPMASCISTLWVCIIIVCKMLYQLKIVNPAEYSSNCTAHPPNETNLKPDEILQSTLYREPVDPANWFGFRKESLILAYIQHHLLLLMLLVFEVTVYRHQEHFRKYNQLFPPSTGTIFQEITRQHLDESVISCAKYLANYFFYKFGLEVCLLMTVNVVGQRMNFLVIIHSCWLVVIVTRRKRQAIAKLWPKYCLFQSLFLLYQYLLCVGIPPALCLDYPWRWASPITIHSNLIKWFYLPDFVALPSAPHLIYDFLLLMCVSHQWQVFIDERKEEVSSIGGANTDVLDPMAGKDLNPVPNYVYCRCYLDMIKVAVFRYLFWLVAAVIFATGSARISVFGLGYLLASFYLLLFGRRLLLKPATSRLNFWDCLIMYNVTAIIAKNMLSLLACVFLKQLQSNFCWMIQLFSLHCTIKGYYDENELKHQECILPIGEAGIIWDSICFFFLLLQRRVFLSYYFIHMAADMRASKLQASRGFQLFNASIIKNMNFHREAEKKSIAQLKRQMERIRTKQEKHRSGRNLIDPSEKEAEEEQGATKQKSQEKKKWWNPWVDHAKVLQSGDYYLFESDSEEDEESLQEEEQPHKPSAFQLVYQAWVTNAKLAVKKRNEDKRKLEKFQQGQAKCKGLQKAGETEGPEASLQETSFQDDAKEEEEETHSKSNVVQRIMDILRFLWVLFLAMMDGLTQWLNTLARQYLDTSTVLWVERYLLTQKLSRGEEVQGPLDGLYENLENSNQTLLQNSEPEESADGDGSLLINTSSSSEEQEEFLTIREDKDLSEPVPGCSTTSNIKEEILVLDSLEPASEEIAVQPITRTRTASELLASSQFFIEELEESKRFYQSQNRFLKLVFAVYNVIAAYSELTCYFIIILNNLISASVITLFLPILMFLWAMLSIPRPSKRFWMTAIIYTEVMVVVKYLFQFGFFPWNSYYITSLYEDKPFFPPRILGLEKTDGYVKYDLIQLLALLFHQSLLKRYGLWDNQEDQKKKEMMKEKEAVQKSQDANMDAAAEEEISVSEPAQEEKKTRFHFRRRKQTKEKENSSPKPKKKRNKKEKASKKLKEFGMKVKNFLFKMVQSIYRPLHKYFSDIINTKYHAATDVYALMFLADVIDFVIIIFGFWAFGKHSAAADIASTLSDDQVPEAFLVMVLIQFSTMVIDRALYLRKTVLGKLIFQIILVFGIHFWMFFILPAVTERMFNQNTVAQLWYFVKCIYFALSAYQIRCGYPTRILGNFLTKKYNHLNLFLFQGFRLVPFLVELRAVMDWVCTDTTLSLSSWMCVEDIYANIFIIKCSRETEKRYPQPKGQKKKKIVKYGMGGLIILFLICIIWFPLLFMSLVRSVVGVVNHPVDVTVTVKLGGYQPLFTMSAQQHSLKPFTQKDYDDLCSTFERNPAAMQFISLYGYEDIMTAHIEGSSGSLWSVSPPSRQAMITELNGHKSEMTLRLMWTFQRDLSLGGVHEHASEKHTINLEPNNPVRKQLADLLLGTRKEPVLISHMLPKYIKAPNGPDAKPVDQMYPEHDDSFLNVTMELQRHVGKDANDSDSILEWWVIQTKTEECKQNECNELQMIIFNDKVSPPSLGFLAGHGIMGLYVSIVLVVGKFVRGFFSEISYSIMFEELPCVDRILKLCHDIFLVRENGELEVEEELYAKLIFLYRSPETMIKWTREKD
ncbi:piezo-type mechanosensitive ion channel component 1 isoform X3 [Scyliorhinus canicula]|uniref:piezo-type mechanosensitive ion channel component 1 isoform X3 n=1 Tax=Scyliorhinus canicula TaxID=7830 RepID=UPI0018F6832E|nr:piezo-type mechanosensitive ion channel component 1 isoform X3 [Scyliorhinus canicula]